jgi:hypothetical protein
MADEMVQVARAESCFVIDANRRIDPAIKTNADRAARIGILALEAVTPKLPVTAVDRLRPADRAGKMSAFTISAVTGIVIKEQLAHD